VKVITLRDRFVNDRTILDFVPLQDCYGLKVVGEGARGDQACDTPADDNRMSELIHELTAALILTLKDGFIARRMASRKLSLQLSAD
jgi:hypothetical protein